MKIQRPLRFLRPILALQARVGGLVMERRKKQEALREKEERFRSTLDTMMEGCQIISRDWRYVYINPAAARHGHSRQEELLGRRMVECYPGIEKSRMFSCLKRCMEERVSIRMENAFTLPDGSTSWFDLSIEPVPDGIFILSIDITERKHVEDNRQDELLILRALRKINLANQVEVARDGQQALDYLFHEGEFAGRTDASLPTVVLLDINLPRVSGLEVLSRLRADPRTRVLPVVILTSSDEEPDRLRSYESGANSFVRKPLDFAEFAETVARLGIYWLVLNEPPHWIE